MFNIDREIAEQLGYFSLARSDGEKEWWIVTTQKGLTSLPRSISGFGDTEFEAWKIATDRCLNWSKDIAQGMREVKRFAIPLRIEYVPGDQEWMVEFETPEVHFIGGDEKPDYAVALAILEWLRFKKVQNYD